MNEEMDLNAQLRSMVTIRGLTEGGSRIPVRKFEGRLVAVVPRQELRQGETTPRLWADLKYDECTIIETTEPYPYNTVEVSIRVSNRKNSGWGIFAGSLEDKLAAEQDIYDCIGARMGLQTEPHQFGFDRTQQEPVLVNGEPVFDQTGAQKMQAKPIVADCWVCYEMSLNGATGPATGGSEGLDAALRVLDGKTEAEFNDQVWSSAAVKADPTVSSMILGRTFLTAMLAGNRVTQDAAGIYHLA